MDKDAMLRIEPHARAVGADGEHTQGARGERLAGNGSEGAPECSDVRVECPRTDPGARLGEAAQEEANRWLALVDAGLYEQSWSSAAALFRQSFTQDEWARTVRATRCGHGRLDERALQAVEREGALPGAPAGSYVLVHFATTRAAEPPLREVVALVEAAGGALLVAAYFLIA